MSDSDSDTESVGIQAPPTPPLPEIDGVEEFTRTPRPATFGDFVWKVLVRPKNEFVYEPLGPDQIRILELKKGEGEQIIECSLIPMRLPRRHQPRFKYQALSYVWGTDDPRDAIRILDARPRQTSSVSQRARQNWAKALKGTGEAEFRLDISFKKIYVRQNLHLALRQFRSKEQDLWLWVDAICIDQDNSKEKSEQLSRMHDIYNKAHNVCIWLGPQYPGSDRAIKFIHRALDLRLLDGLVSLTDAAEALIERATDWSCLTELMSASWFSRRWVVQEVALARNASLHCGKSRIHWYNFADAVANFVTKLEDVRLLYKKVNNSKFNPESLSFVESLGAKVMVATTSDLFRKSEDGDILERLLSLETLVSTLTTFDAGNPRDMIYALFSLAKDSPLVKAPPRSKSSDTRVLLQPDYAKHPLEVYTDFVRYCVKSGSLDIICRHWAMPFRAESTALANSVSQIHSPVVELPTWIGLLENSPFGPPSRLTGRVNGDSLVGAPNEPRYNASDGEGPVVRFEPRYISKHGNGQSESARESYDVTLHCKGLKLATVTKLSARLVNATISKDCLDMGGWKKDEMGKLPSRVPEKLWRTLCADRGPDGKNSPSWYHRACLHCLATTSPSGDVSTGELIRDENSPALMVAYLKRVQNIVWSRKVLEAISTSGKSPSELLFGLASEKVEVDDVVCILFGCTVPVILRPLHDKEHGDHFAFMGEAYIHGKMDGEALSGLDQAALDARTVEFSIR